MANDMRFAAAPMARNSMCGSSGCSSRCAKYTFTNGRNINTFVSLAGSPLSTSTMADDPSAANSSPYEEPPGKLPSGSVAAAQIRYRA